MSALRSVKSNSPPQNLGVNLSNVKGTSGKPIRGEIEMAEYSFMAPENGNPSVTLALPEKRKSRLIPTPVKRKRNAIWKSRFPKGENRPL